MTGFEPAVGHLQRQRHAFAVSDLVVVNLKPLSHTTPLEHPVTDVPHRNSTEFALEIPFNSLAEL